VDESNFLLGMEQDIFNDLFSPDLYRNLFLNLGMALMLFSSLFMTLARFYLSSCAALDHMVQNMVDSYAHQQGLDKAWEMHQDQRGKHQHQTQVIKQREKIAKQLYKRMNGLLMLEPPLKRQAGEHKMDAKMWFRMKIHDFNQLMRPVKKKDPENEAPHAIEMQKQKTKKHHQERPTPKIKLPSNDGINPESAEAQSSLDGTGSACLDKWSGSSNQASTPSNAGKFERILTGSTPTARDKLSGQSVTDSAEIPAKASELEHSLASTKKWEPKKTDFTQSLTPDHGAHDRAKLYEVSEADDCAIPHADEKQEKKVRRTKVEKEKPGKKGDKKKVKQAEKDRKRAEKDH